MPDAELAVWTRRAKFGVAVLALVSTTYVGAVAVDSRYAKASDIDEVRRQLGGLRSDVQETSLVNNITYLHGEQSRIESVRAQRPLTPIEQDRYLAIQTDLADAHQRLIELRSKRRD